MTASMSHPFCPPPHPAVLPESVGSDEERLDRGVGPWFFTLRLTFSTIGAFIAADMGPEAGNTSDMVLQRPRSVAFEIYHDLSILYTVYTHVPFVLTYYDKQGLKVKIGTATWKRQ